MERQVSIIKITAAAVACALAMSSVNAFAFVGPMSKPAIDGVVEQIKAKKTKKKKAVAGKCGAFMYFDKKTKKCADARLKK